MDALRTNLSASLRASRGARPGVAAGCFSTAGTRHLSGLGPCTIHSTVPSARCRYCSGSTIRRHAAASGAAAGQTLPCAVMKENLLGFASAHLPGWRGGCRALGDPRTATYRWRTDFLLQPPPIRLAAALECAFKLFLLHRPDAEHPRVHRAERATGLHLKLDKLFQQQLALCKTPTLPPGRRSRSRHASGAG